MAILDRRCPIWNTPARQVPPTTRTTEYYSPRAGGVYKITSSAEAVVGHWSPQKRALLSSWIVESLQASGEAPTISTAILDRMDCRPRQNAVQRAQRLLEYCEARTGELGTPIVLDLINTYRGNNPDDTDPSVQRDAMLAYTESLAPSELQFLFDYLVAKNWLERPVGGAGYRLTVDGLVHLDNAKAVAGSGDQAFVAMWFDPSMDALWEEGIAPACQDAGYRALRIDKKDHNNKIDDEIISEIRRSCFLVADFTHGEKGQRGGVYYEAGFAQGLRIPTIFTCRSDCMDTVHFDTRQYNHITWDTPDRLRPLLAQRISATLGSGPGKRPGS